MGPGCAAIFGSLFGYVSGVRRQRNDLVRIGEATADGELASLQRALVDGALGDWDGRNPAMPGFPALMVSGSMGGRPMDLALSFSILDQVVQQMGTQTIGSRDKALLAVVLAEASQLDPQRQEDLVEAARTLAHVIEPTGERPRPYAAMAQCAVARASRDPEDRARARTMVQLVLPKVTVRDGVAQLEFVYQDNLSFHLAVVHAIADFTRIEPRNMMRTRAVELLDYVFSDAYFDGRFIMHDRVNGRSTKFCSGCNFWALHLADRYYGDTLSFDGIGVPAVRRENHESPKDAPPG
jgi:hypothetical protein